VLAERSERRVVVVWWVLLWRLVDDGVSCGVCRVYWKCWWKSVIFVWMIELWLGCVADWDNYRRNWNCLVWFLRMKRMRWWWIARGSLMVNWFVTICSLLHCCWRRRMWKRRIERRSVVSVSMTTVVVIVVEVAVAVAAVPCPLLCCFGPSPILTSITSCLYCIIVSCVRSISDTFCFVRCFAFAIVLFCLLTVSKMEFQRTT